jgi:hypothetical protein
LLVQPFRVFRLSVSDEGLKVDPQFSRSQDSPPESCAPPKKRSFDQPSVAKCILNISIGFMDEPSSVADMTLASPFQVAELSLETSCDARETGF